MMNKVPDEFDDDEKSLDQGSRGFTANMFQPNSHNKPANQHNIGLHDRKIPGNSINPMNKTMNLSKPPIHPAENSSKNPVSNTPSKYIVNEILAEINNYDQNNIKRSLSESKYDRKDFKNSFAEDSFIWEDLDQASNKRNLIDSSNVTIFQDRQEDYSSNNMQSRIIPEKPRSPFVKPDVEPKNQENQYNKIYFSQNDKLPVVQNYFLNQNLPQPNQGILQSHQNRPNESYFNQRSNSNSNTINFTDPNDRITLNNPTSSKENPINQNNSYRAASVNNSPNQHLPEQRNPIDILRSLVRKDIPSSNFMDSAVNQGSQNVQNQSNNVNVNNGDVRNYHFSYSGQNENGILNNTSKNNTSNNLNSNNVVVMPATSNVHAFNTNNQSPLPGVRLDARSSSMPDPKSSPFISPIQQNYPRKIMASPQNMNQTFINHSESSIDTNLTQHNTVNTVNKNTN